MNDKINLIIRGIITVLFAILGIVFLKTSVAKYSILCFTITAILIFVIVNKLLSSKDAPKIYERTIKSILNTYDSILVRCTSIPDLSKKNIVTVSSIDDLVDAQLEIKKPICYIKQTESISFMLLDEKEAYVHTIKLYESSLSPLEIELKNINIKNKNNNNKDVDYELLKDIEKTTIVILPDKKSYKVSPVKKEQKIISKEEIEII